MIVLKRVEYKSIIMYKKNIMYESCEISDKPSLFAVFADRQELTYTDIIRSSFTKLNN